MDQQFPVFVIENTDVDSPQGVYLAISFGNNNTVWLDRSSDDRHGGSPLLVRAGLR